MLMADEDKSHDGAARRTFNQQATDSLLRHDDELARSKQVASDADLDLKQRKKYRRKRADSMRTKKKRT